MQAAESHDDIVILVDVSYRIHRIATAFFIRRRQFQNIGDNP